MIPQQSRPPPFAGERRATARLMLKGRPLPPRHKLRNLGVIGQSYRGCKQPWEISRAVSTCIHRTVQATVHEFPVHTPVKRARENETQGSQLSSGLQQVIMPNAVLPVESPPPTLQPLAELPALVIADASRDVRGWEIRSDAGHILAVVSDLLADPDRLVAEFLVVTPAGAGHTESFVPVAALAARPPHLVLGSGLQPIKLRYVSTVRLTTRTATAAALLVLIVWSFRVFAC